MSEMFSKTKQRYMTTRIEQELDKSFIAYIWELIEEEKKHVKLDYLQVMKLTKEIDIDGKIMMQRIVHSQEQSPYQQVYFISVDEKLIEGKIFLIDELDYCVMLFAEEY